MNKKRTYSQTLKSFLILAIILFVPGFFYFFLKEKGSNSYQRLPYYGISAHYQRDTGGEASLTKTGDDNSYSVPAVDLYNENGERMTVPSSDSSISVVNFFYSVCPSFCRQMNQTINRVAGRFSKSKRVKFYSISIDPNDSLDRLKQYAVNFSEKGSNWHFFTATSGQVDLMLLSRKHYFLDALRDTTSSDVIIHSPQIVLLDSKRHIRGYYNSNEPQDVDRLMDEMIVLITEERRNY